jgi:phosphoglycerate dehydrogenase-like enzyme
MLVALALLLVSSASSSSYSATNVALVGSGFLNYDAADLARAIKTDWKVLSENGNNTAEELREVSALIQLSNTTAAKFSTVPNAKWYSFEYTGISDAVLRPVPSSMVVTNCHQAAIPIAEYVIANILGIVVNIRGMDSYLRNCTWKSEAPGNTCNDAVIRKPHRQLTDGNLTLGILGYGSIGKQVATRAAALGLRVVGTTLNPPLHPPQPLAWLGFDKDNARLMQESDFLMIGCPLTNSTKGMVNGTFLDLMKPSAWLINIARAAVVDETSLWNVLRPKQPPVGSIASGAGAAATQRAAQSSHSIAGAVLDVWWNSAFKLPPGDNSHCTTALRLDCYHA